MPKRLTLELGGLDNHKMVSIVHMTRLTSVGREHQNIRVDQIHRFVTHENLYEQKK